MAITEHHRHQLFQRLEKLLGVEEATTLMEHLPPVGWADVATKSDLNHHQALASAALDRATVELRGEISQVRTDLGKEIAQARTDLSRDITRSHTDLELKMERGFREQTRTMVLTNVGSMGAFAAVLIAAVKI